MIHIAAPEIDAEEIAAVNEVLRSGMLAQGSRVAALEEAFAEFCGTKYAVAVNSGTAAIHAALFAAGVGPGDEVITTPFSFIATVNPILMVGAKPVFVDIDPVTFNIDPAQIEAKVTSATKAIIPVHLYGQPVDYDAIDAIAKKHNLVVIEDACQAIGAAYKGNRVGGLGDIGCFSLYATKNIMSGEGGMITTNNEEYANAMKRFRQHGMSGTYQYEHLGYNYRTTDLCAAIALEQLKKAERFNGARQATAAQFDAGLEGVGAITLPTIGADRTHVYHQYTIRLREESGVDRTAFIEALKERGVGAGVYYPKPLHTIAHIAQFGYKEGDFPEAEKASRQVISLPVHPKVSTADADTIIAAVRELTNVE